MAEKSAPGPFFINIQEGEYIHIDPTRVSRSIYLSGFKAATKPDKLVMNLQRRKNGGGDIDKVVISSKLGAAAITFDSAEGKIFVDNWLP